MVRNRIRMDLRNCDVVLSRFFASMLVWGTRTRMLVKHIVIYRPIFRERAMLAHHSAVSLAYCMCNAQCVMQKKCMFTRSLKQFNKILQILQTFTWNKKWNQKVLLCCLWSQQKILSVVYDHNKWNQKIVLYCLWSQQKRSSFYLVRRQREWLHHHTWKCPTALNIRCQRLCELQKHCRMQYWIETFWFFKTMCDRLWDIQDMCSHIQNHLWFLAQPLIIIINACDRPWKKKGASPGLFLSVFPTNCNIFQNGGGGEHEKHAVWIS